MLGADQPPWLRVIQFALFGTVNSLQFTAMNTITLRDLDGELASGGNSLLSMVMMLSMSLGVAAASGLLAGFTHIFTAGQGLAVLPALHATFACVGLVTAASACIFWQLEPKTQRARPQPPNPIE